MTAIVLSFVRATTNESAVLTLALVHFGLDIGGIPG